MEETRMLRALGRLAPRFCIGREFVFALALCVGLPGSSSLIAQDVPDAGEFVARETSTRFFLRGDANLDGIFSLADVFSILRFNFLGGPMACLDAADVDDSGQIDQTDALFLFDAIFNRRRTPPEPFLNLGRDPTHDSLDCERGLSDGPSGEGLVLGLGAATPCTDPNAGADLEFIHTLARVFVYPGQQSVRIPVFFTSVAGQVEGFTLSLYSPPELVELEGVRFAETAVLDSVVRSGRAWVNNFESLRSAGYIASTVVLSATPPFETLPSLPYPGGIVAYLELNVRADVAVGSEISVEFRDTPNEDGLPPIRNELSREGSSHRHRACGLTLEVVPERDVFLRGDADRNWRLDISDAVSILSTLFHFPGVRQTACPDAADVDDDGSLRLTDALLVLNFLFRNGVAPAHPYPVAGLDTPLEDALSCLEE
jgi:hypothetical protein